jgi:hypothetical protein
MKIRIQDDLPFVAVTLTIVASNSTLELVALCHLTARQPKSLSCITDTGLV